MHRDAASFDINFGEDFIRFRDMGPYAMDLHAHNDLQITIPLEYTSFEVFWTHETGGQERKLLNAGGICLMPPMFEHGISWLTRAHFVNLHVHPDTVAGIVGKLYDLDAVTLDEQIGVKDAFLQNIGHGISHFARLHGKKADDYYRSAISLAVHHIYATYSSSPGKTISFGDVDRLPCPKIRKAVNHLFANIDRVVTIGELADTVGLSAFHFMRMFKQQTGMSPAKFHLMYRLESAKKMLVETTQPVASISEALGFSSQGHFSTLFTKSFGVTPVKFRRQSSRK